MTKIIGIIIICLTDVYSHSDFCGIEVLFHICSDGGRRRKVRPRRRTTSTLHQKNNNNLTEISPPEQEPASSSRESSASNHNENSALLPVSRQHSQISNASSERRYKFLILIYLHVHAKPSFHCKSDTQDYVLTRRDLQILVQALSCQSSK